MSGDKALTRREQLEAGFDAAEHPVEDGTELGSAPEVTSEPKSDRPRDETGKFVKPDKQSPKVGEQPSPKTGGQQPAEDKYAKPPKSWKQDFHNHYTGLAPEVRAYLHQREEEQLRGVEPLKTKAHRADLIDQALGPVGQHLAARGVGVDSFLRDISQTVWTLANGTPEQKRATLFNIAKSYGVEIAQQAAAAADAQTQQDPRLAKLEAELNGMKTHFQAQQQAREQAEWAQVANSIKEFESNNEKYPHFSTVRVTMGRLIETGEADSMESAYTKAVRLHDDIWAQEQAKQAAEAEAKKKAEQDARAKAARASAVSPRTASPAGGQSDDTGKPKGRRATVAAALEQHLGHGRV